MAQNVMVVAEGTVYQRPNERIAYKLTTTNFESSPATPVVTAFDQDIATDVTTTVFPSNSPSAVADVITLDLLRALTAGHSYKICVKFTVGTNIHEPYFIVKCVE